MTLSPFILGLPIYLVGFNYIVLSHAFWVLSRLFFSLVIGYSYSQVFILQFYSSEIKALEPIQFVKGEPQVQVLEFRNNTKNYNDIKYNIYSTYNYNERKN